MYSPAMERFFEKLRETPRKWAFSYRAPPGGAKCLRLGACCPISSIKGKDFAAYRSVGMEIGLSNAEISDIVAAADDVIFLWRAAERHAIREKLIECCGLKEVA